MQYKVAADKAEANAQKVMQPASKTTSEKKADSQAWWADSKAGSPK